jgi:hypothetical protein
MTLIKKYTYTDCIYCLILIHEMFAINGAAVVIIMKFANIFMLDPVNTNINKFKFI